MIGYKRLSLTDIKIDIGRVANAWTEADVEGQWAGSTWGKKLAARKAKASANDFDRFKGMFSHKGLMKKVRAAVKSA